VINNAAVMTTGSPLTVPLAAIRRDLEVNHLGLLSVARAFAPVLAASGGGALVNVLSVLSWTTVPVISAHAASKAAAWSMTNALRQALRAQRTLVVAVHSDTIDTDMSRVVDRPKHDPREVAEAVVRAIANGDEEVLFDDYTRTVKASLPDDLRLLYSSP
jgi:short-subunit dehydrogenase